MFELGKDGRRLVEVRQSSFALRGYSRRLVDVRKRLYKSTARPETKTRRLSDVRNRQ